jgi:DNA-binding NtrC family response regulator
VRLLRVLQEREYEPLGAAQTVKANVRIITATYRNLAERVRQGAFREDLFHRINVVSLTLPPLRDRMEDIPLLAEHFIARFNAVQVKDVTGITDGALACLMAYGFPGNVRELENIIERAFVTCRGGQIEPRHLPEIVCGAPPRAARAAAGLARFRQAEAAFIANALDRNGGNRRRTARKLGVHPTTLYRKMKALGIDVKRGEGRAPR